MVIRVPMEEALQPDQCRQVQRFLVMLLYYSEGVQKPDVASFMAEYREQVITGELGEERGQPGC